jgi:formylmethanofuran dehydrogenase subunit E
MRSALSSSADERRESVMIDIPDMQFIPTDEPEGEIEYPKCPCCGEEIEGEYYYDINGEIFCIDCLNENYRRRT